MFKEISNGSTLDKDLDEAKLDPCVVLMKNKTEEGQKVERNSGDKYWAVFEKISKNKME